MHAGEITARLPLDRPAGTASGGRRGEGNGCRIRPRHPRRTACAPRPATHDQPPIGESGRSRRPAGHIGGGWQLRRRRASAGGRSRALGRTCRRQSALATACDGAPARRDRRATPRFGRVVSDPRWSTGASAAAGDPHDPPRYLYAPVPDACLAGSVGCNGPLAERWSCRASNAPRYRMCESRHRIVARRDRARHGARRRSHRDPSRGRRGLLRPQRRRRRRLRRRSGGPRRPGAQSAAQVVARRRARVRTPWAADARGNGCATRCAGPGGGVDARRLRLHARRASVAARRRGGPAVGEAPGRAAGAEYAAPGVGPRGRHPPQCLAHLRLSGPGSHQALHRRCARAHLGAAGLGRTRQRLRDRVVHGRTGPRCGVKPRRVSPAPPWPRCPRRRSTRCRARRQRRIGRYSGVGTHAVQESPMLRRRRRRGRCG